MRLRCCEFRLSRRGVGLVASIRTHHAREIRQMIVAARVDADLMVGAGSRKMRFLVRGKLGSRAYSRTLDQMAPKLWESWVYVTCSRSGSQDYEFEFVLAEMDASPRVYGGLV